VAHWSLLFSRFLIPVDAILSHVPALAKRSVHAPSERRNRRRGIGTPPGAILQEVALQLGVGGIVERKLRSWAVVRL
jgi:hypothetical protein